MVSTAARNHAASAAAIFCGACRCRHWPLLRGLLPLLTFEIEAATHPDVLLRLTDQLRAAATVFASAPEAHAQALHAEFATLAGLMAERAAAWPR